MTDAVGRTPAGSAGCPWACAPLLLLLCFAWALAPAPARGQEDVPLFLVDPGTVVSDVGFSYSRASQIDPGRLEDQIAMEGAGALFGLRSALGALPLIPSPRRQSFDPPTLYRDMVRLERFYRQEGFPEAAVSYDVVLDTAENAVDVTYVIREGPPIVLDTLVLTGPDGAPVEALLPPELHASWEELRADLAARQGTRLGATLRTRIQDRVTGWLRDRGYPFPATTGTVEITDTLPAWRLARFHVTVHPGSRMRVGSVVVQGNQRLSASTIRRQVPLDEGDWFSQAQLAEGQNQLFGLDLVRLAVTDVGRGSPGSDQVEVRVRITEGEPYLLSGRLGWGAGFGITGDVSWQYRDFLGGARTLEISTVARTGILAREATRERRYGLAVSVRQPWLGDYRVEGIARPFVEYRDDLRDESIQYGIDLSSVYQRGPRRNVTLRYALTTRHVIEAGPGVVFGGDTDLLGLLAALDTLDLDRRVSSISAIGNWARAPGQEPGLRTDWTTFASAEIAGPRGLSTVEYFRLVGQVGGFLPIGRGVAVRARVGGGRVWPFGVSIPAPDGADRLESYFKLRDAVLTAGGSESVRGWGTDLLGPKAPDVDAFDGSAAISSRYLPLGGLARWTGSLQLEVPMPLLGSPNRIHAFLDAGRIWTPDGRFLPTEEPVLPGQLGDRARWGTGIGVSFSTPVGPLQIDLGYKLNPSPLDIRDAEAVARALLEDRPIETVPTDFIRRLHLHLSVGGVS